jgi:hypothetical protein
MLFFEEDILVAIVDQKRQEVLAEVNQEHQERCSEYNLLFIKG